MHHLYRNKPGGTDGEGSIIDSQQIDLRNSRIFNFIKNIGKLPSDSRLHPMCCININFLLHNVIKGPDIIKTSNMILVFMGKNNRIQTFYRSEEHLIPEIRA